MTDPVKGSQKRAGQDGMALVLVLSFLIIISALILAFYFSVTGELQVATSYSAGVRSRNLADTAVHVVMGTIRTATSRGTGVAWASQPGMIRTYGTSSGGASASPLSYYKLYSSQNMEVTASQTGSFDPGADVDGQWDAKPALFADLNSPVFDAQGNLRFPVIDPRVQSSPGASTVDGFSYSDTLTLSVGGSVKVSQVNTGGGDPSKQRVPMPVKWLYQLKDGTLTAPTGVDASGSIANWTGAPAYKTPSATNPIVGRIAFWTDDESCKVNINTAAGDIARLEPDAPGSFWDTPRAGTSLDYELTRRQVATNEFQRYPGHPSTVALSTVFPSLTREEIGTLAPRVAFGGSQGGTQENWLGGVPFLARKTDRLYASVDELMFKPTLSSTERDETLPVTVTSDALEQVRFFLTCNSRAPDLNLFGQPRVSMWPIHAKDSSDYRTASDKLLAFCTTVGGQRYHFTRGTAAGGSTSTDRTADYAGNLRNQQLYAYLRSLTDKPIPGFGGPAKGFGDKYGTLNRDQILTEIFDYIRITNLQDKSLPSNSRFTPRTTTPGSGQVVPIKITTAAGDTKGFGRMGTISEAALQFIASEVKTSPAPAKTTKMRAVLLLEAFCAAPGFIGYYHNSSYTVTGLENLTITIGAQTLNLNFPANATNNLSRSQGFHSRSAAGVLGISPAFYTPTGAFKTVPGLDPDINYPFISQTDIDISAATATTMKLNGGTINLTIKDRVTGATVQTIALTFPPIQQLPLPAAPLNPDSPVTVAGNLKTVNYSQRIAQLNNSSSFDNIIDQMDVVHSLEPSGSPVNGDLRLVATSESVPDTIFQPHAAYANNTRFAYSLKLAQNAARYSGSPTFGKLIETVNYGSANYWNPDMPSKITTGARMSSGILGDWDNGVADYMDGPYINKPDEGNVAGTTSGGQQVGKPPYWSSNADDTGAFETLFSGTLYSPNRQMASPVMLGSLSTGVKYSPQRPWQTLLFRPDVTGTHPGSIAPKDYLLIDLFTMPVVEPYAISEPLSTSGKVNMNYQIAPFTYITRETALRAALQSIWTLAIPNSEGAIYKKANSAGDYRSQVDPGETLKQFKAKFDSAQLFKSATEICDLHLVPKGTKLTTMQSATYWDDFKLTGDNSREMPYNHLYPLLTTKSNTYTVYYRVQVLKKSRSSGAAVWDEDKDTVASEQRGSSVIERYVDAADTTLPDFATDLTKNLDSYYKFRVINAKRL
jgi:uncharacterized protein (TIGR02600 family)